MEANLQSFVLGAIHRVAEYQEARILITPYQYFISCESLRFRPLCFHPFGPCARYDRDYHVYTHPARFFCFLLTHGDINYLSVFFFV